MDNISKESIIEYLKSTFGKACYTTIIVSIIGAIGSCTITDLQQEHEIRKISRLQKQKALESLRSFAKDVDTLRIHASMLHSALDRYANGKTDFLKQVAQGRKKAYDKVYMNWFSTVQKNALRIREAQKITYPTLYEHAINQQINFFLRKYDNYLTNRFDSLLKGKNENFDSDIKIFLKNINEEKTLNYSISKKMSICTKEIINATHDWIAKGKTCNHEEWNKTKITAMYSNINSDEKCGFNPNPKKLPKTLFPQKNKNGKIVSFCLNT